MVIISICSDYQNQNPETAGTATRKIIPLVIIMFRKKDGGISVVAKKRSAIRTFF
jgi:hypothetical protein